MNDSRTGLADSVFGAGRPLLWQGHAVEKQPSRDARLSALSEGALSDRFCFWRGRSGRRYVFSVYQTSDAGEPDVPRYTEAVMIAARRGDDGRRRILRVGRTGRLSELMVSVSERADRFDEDADEVHFHLLARGNAEREAIVSDLAGHDPDETRPADPARLQKQAISGI